MSQGSNVDPERTTGDAFYSWWSPQRATERGSASAPLRLLLVEDDPGDVLLTMTVFDKTGIDAEWSHAGKLADVDFDSVGDQVDCVLVDLSLPDCYGLEAVSGILRRTPRLPVVVLSGSSNRDLALAAVRLGAQDYLVKDQISPEMMSKSIRYAIERKLIEHELQQAQQLARLGRLAGGIGHHFNNLLAIIGSYAAFLAESLAGAPPGQADHWQEARDDVHNIRQAAQRATELTRQLLTFAEQDIANPQLIKLNEIIEDEADLLAARLGDGIKLDMSLAPDVCPILVDRGHIQQLLACLANNARDAMPGGGRMLISTARGQDLEGTGGPPTRSYARLQVHDTGTGIGGDIIDNVFDPFFTTRPVGQGAGLGLTVVHAIMTRWGGRVKVHSAPGAGTTVTMRFPDAATAG